jgi:hypothetical protein
MMMSKIIIENTSQVSDMRAMHKVQCVMDLGFISGENQYCYVTTFTDCIVYARDTRGTTHSFKVEDNDENS